MCTEGRAVTEYCAIEFKNASSEVSVSCQSEALTVRNHSAVQGDLELLRFPAYAVIVTLTQ